MKKYFIAGILIMLIFVSGYSQARSINIMFGEEYLNIKARGNSDLYIGAGINFTADDLPLYTPFEGNPYYWWELRGIKNKNNGVEVFVGKYFRVQENLEVSPAVGYAFQDKVKLYRSTASYLYFGEESTEYFLTLQGDIQYKVNDTLKINMGYHNLHGLMLGFSATY